MSHLEIKDCPLCGGRPLGPETRLDRTRITHVIRCRPCSLVLSSGPDREDAMAAWNQRVGMVHLNFPTWVTLSALALAILAAVGILKLLL